MRAIPHNNNIETYQKHDFINSPLVKIPKETGIIIDMQYPKLGMKNAIKECLVRKEVLDKLLKAKRYLPKGYTFKIWDAYRPFSLQEEIYNTYKGQLINYFKLYNLSKEKQDKIIKNYVSIPNKNEELPPLHATGGAIDLTIADIKTGKDLDMGIKFDQFTNLTNTDAFENKKMNQTIKNNRRLLYNCMIKAGFTNLPSEIWHYDYGNRAWAYYKKKPAIYNGIFK